jgi:hypothetical protein
MGPTASSHSIEEEPSEECASVFTVAAAKVRVTGNVGVST